MKISCAFFRLLFGFCLASSVMPMFSMQRVKKIVGQLRGRSDSVVKADRRGTKDLWDAIARGYVEAVKYWLDKGIHKEPKDENGETPLLRAVYSGQWDVVKYLVEQGADKEARDWLGRTPLLMAVINGQLDLVKYLVEQRADKEARTRYGRTPLLMAVINGRSDIVKYLVEQGVVIDESLAEKLIEVLLADTDKNFYLLLAGKGYSSDHPIYRERLNRSLLDSNIKQVEFLMEIGVNPYQMDDDGLNAFDYTEDNPELVAALNKTKHEAVAKQEVVEQESDTQKALRRLQHIKRAMQPEVPTPSSKGMKDIVVPGGLSPTEAHWKLFGAEIEKEYGKVLDEPLVKKILAREKEAIAQGNYVFYRSEPGKYRVYQDFLQELYKLVNLYSKENRFVWNRFFKDAAKEQTINEYIDTMQPRAHKTGAEFNVLLSANISLFGNVRNSGSCTWDYFLKNYEATGAVTLPDMFKRIFDQYGFDEKYIDQLLALHQGVLEKTATLQQIIVPKDIVDDVVMFSTHGYCFPWQEQVDKGQADSCWDPNAISVDLKGNPKKGRYTCISSIIDKYRDGRIAIDDAYQVRILMNAVYGLNPESGIEIYQYTRLPEKKLQHFKTQVQKITDEMFGEWLKEQLSKKEVPESIKDEKLGGVLQYLGKGRKEPVKSKL